MVISKNFKHNNIKTENPKWRRKKTNQKLGILLNHTKKSRIRETKHLSTDADSSTDNTVGWTKNTQKPNFLKNKKNHPKRKKLKNVWKYAKINNMPFDQRSLIHQETWFPGGPRRPKNPFFLKNGKITKNKKNSNMSRDMPKLAIRPSTRGLYLIHREVWFLPCFVRQNQPKK